MGRNTHCQVKKSFDLKVDIFEPIFTSARIASVSWYEYDVLACALNCLCVKEVLVKTGRRSYIIVS